MNKFFYTKLALNNIKNNRKTYFPYIITGIITVAMYFIINTITKDSALKDMSGGAIIQSYLCLGTYVIIIFSAIFLFYTNNFLIKNRKKELGLFNILGMGKRHLAIVLLIEKVIVFLINLTFGILLGYVFSKASVLLLFKMLDFNVRFGMDFSFSSAISCIIVFGIIYGLTLLNDLRQIHLSKPVELLQGGSVGEKEPKTKIIMTIIGLACIVFGYYLAVTAENPVKAILSFFVAVVLVIIGTYLLFTTCSIFVLKLLKQKKNYYYKLRHFINVSSMIYRMKQNAMGLSNICILSTMVLVTLSSTVSLYTGMKDMISTKYPNEICVEVSKGNFSKDNINNIISSKIHELGIEDGKRVQYDYMTISTEISKNKNQYNLISLSHKGFMDITEIYMISLDNFKTMQGNIKEELLDIGDVLVYVHNGKIDGNVIKIEDKTFSISKKLDSSVLFMNQSSNAINSMIVVVKDDNVIDEMYDKMMVKYNNKITTKPDYKAYFGLDFEGDSDKKIEVLSNIKEKLSSEINDIYIQGRSNNKKDFYAVYGGLFFLGIFLGILFIMITVLIMYYKQITEGFNDRTRFMIMKQVGMSEREVKKSIHSQVIKVFFFPLIVAGIHTCFAFPIISKILRLLGLVNTNVFMIWSIVTFLIFALFYVIVYMLTAKIYYKIIK